MFVKNFGSSLQYRLPKFVSCVFVHDTVHPMVSIAHTMASLTATVIRPAAGGMVGVRQIHRCRVG